MNHVEIERKWMMAGYPPLEAETEEEMEQGYLSFSPAVRIRKSVCGGQASYHLTIKGGGALCRTEVELPLEAGQYAALREMQAGPSAKKCLRRYRLPGGQQLECSHVDAGEPGAFYYAEVEFDSEEEAHAFAPPPYLGREVTGEPGHSMSAYCRGKAEAACGT